MTPVSLNYAAIAREHSARHPPAKASAEETAASRRTVTQILRVAARAGILETLRKPHSHPQAAEGFGTDPLPSPTPRPPHTRRGQGRGSAAREHLPSPRGLSCKRLLLALKYLHRYVCTGSATSVQPCSQPPVAPPIAELSTAFLGAALEQQESRQPVSRNGQCRPLFFELSLPTVFQLRRGSEGKECQVYLRNVLWFFSFCLENAV